MFRNIFVILFLFTASLMYGQVDIPIVSKHEHEEDSYHCGQCKIHLFDASEATLINKDELHYHGIATDSTKVAFHCAACKSHVGYYIFKDYSYQVTTSNIHKNSSSNFSCASCQLPLFNQKNLFNSDASSLYFSEPIDDKRVSLDERNKFYKLEIAKEYATCAKCNGRLGHVDKNDSHGFGLRINLRAIEKRKN